MSSANYIPLTQISPSEYRWHPRTPTTHAASSLSSYFSRKRAVLALVATSSVITLFVFLKLSLGSADDFDDIEFHVNPLYQPSYIAIPVPDFLPDAARPKLRPVRDLPTECLEQYYVSGLPCHDGQGPVPMDVIWTWVNGSDPLFIDSRTRAANSYAKDDPYRPIKSNNPSRMFRDHDELRHSIRSVLDNFRPYTGNFRILTSDFDFPDEDPDSNQSFSPPGPGYWRLGLQPQWLNTAGTSPPVWRDGDVQLSLTHHAHFFEPYNHSIFNSYAIETQFSHLQDLSEIFLYMNDDFYMTSTLTPFTFYTQQYGLVLRMQQDMTVAPEWPDEKTKGEWRSMGVSNYLLSKRFGQRHRPYVQHEAKSVSFAILQEVALVWPSWIAKSATHAFRETEAGDGDFYQMFVFAHFIVERAREALLWSWVVGRIGGTDDSWSEREFDRAWVELGGGREGDRSHEINVESGMRETLHMDRVRDYLKQGGIEGTFRTDYHFSSLDGYAYNPYGRRGEGGWPGYNEDAMNDPEKHSCTIKRDECFGIQGVNGGPPTASEVFKEIAFNKPQCGDCMIVSLVESSGSLGLSSFLPHADRTSPSSNERATDDSATIPHLPLVDDWHEGQFALRDVMRYAPETNVREWTMRLLQRYRYVIGGTSSMFERMISLQQVRGMLAAVDRNQDLALLCINDDVTRDDAEVAVVFRRWQEKRWGIPAAWESDVHSSQRRTLDSAVPPL
ncbi:hypothetical protein L226DRAFT_535831 [Lentinus tigrinus ALCF2SS1-7]|uniref:Stealth protein CR3 conserved region 3 domain-containing protein n=1 Tax=Lentinus tigrinus ALCF2SS1-6 TaxID=1328759 RepID=A0A5C2RYX4_9APHY|nr:hypothetical protein L227DRAFT_532375 [Lentinus tigrinus ALCF2SS1-6]RPD73927.1 hypothetical protein L226DRAFT_535831 [Lentinus tigrinus ALCF2SS1-7]